MTQRLSCPILLPMLRMLARMMNSVKLVSGLKLVGSNLMPIKLAISDSIERCYFCSYTEHVELILSK